jgi:sigma-B regulation protein RsbU (phosphoserine phosphatase)
MQEEAQKTMRRELHIAILRIMLHLKDAEWAVEDLEGEVAQVTHHPKKVCEKIREYLQENPIPIRLGIAFEPYYYPSYGRWFEAICTRVGDGDGMVEQQVGGPGHDYFTMEWYKEGIRTKNTHGHWSRIYKDTLADYRHIMSFSRPQRDHDGNIVGVACLDVSFEWIYGIMKRVEPYPGSICQLLTTDGDIILSSENKEINSDDYFILSEKFKYRELILRIACPKPKVYGDLQLLYTITLVLIIACLAILMFITLHYMINANEISYLSNEKAMIDREMNIAHDIQMDILRTNFPQDASFEIDGGLRPMKMVGGDLYDFCQRDGDLYFIVGDVSGKGIPAALFMSATVDLFRMAARRLSTPEEIVHEINTILSENNPSMTFVTVFVGKLNTRHGLLTFCNAGHNPPIFNGDYLTVTPNIPIGYKGDFSFEQQGIFFPQGSRLILYTDGITESRNKERKLLGTSAWLKMVNSHANETIDKLVESLVSDVDRYAEDTTQSDDITLLCIGNKVSPVSPTITISNDIEGINLLKPLLQDYCICMGMSKSVARKMRLAIEEAVANVINYAYGVGEYGEISLDIQKNDDEVSFIIKDKGKPFDPNAQDAVDIEKAVDDRQVGGLGIFLFKKLMDEVRYERSEDGYNILTLIKKLEKK